MTEDLSRTVVSKEFVDNIIKSISHPFYVVDAHDYSIKLANYAADPTGQWQNSTCHLLTHKSSKPCDDKDHGCPLELVKKTKRPAVMEHLHYDKDGRRKYYEVHGYPVFNDNGDVIQMIEHSIDITERKKAEEELQQKQKELLEKHEELKITQFQMLQREKMASIGQLAAGVAHEINNPIGFISSNLGTLGKYMNKLTEFINAQTEAVELLKATEVMEGLKDRRRKLKLDYIIEDVEQLIDESLEGAERVKKIVQNLKSFSRIDESENKPADINECIESTLNIIWNELKYKTTVEKEYGEIPLTKCYPQQLNQVFMNLLVNASQAIEKQGKIKIKTWNGDGTINVSISDTGQGIPEEKIDKVFEPFFTTKEVGKGTGLGLSISYDIVKKHNGNITVNSEVGKGTTFTVNIPVSEG